jgi:hypothetical protein
VASVAADGPHLIEWHARQRLNELRRTLEDMHPAQAAILQAKVDAAGEPAGG